MDGQVPADGKEIPRLEIPEDVAVLYAWANLEGSRYRDFSASRRESRAQVRQRAAQSLREAEARAKAKAEESAQQSEDAAREAAGIARFHQAQARRLVGEHRRGELERQQAAQERASLQADDLRHRATLERAEAARREVGLQAAEEAARREAQEVGEAHVSAQRQAQQYDSAEAHVAADPERTKGGSAFDYSSRIVPVLGCFDQDQPAPAEEMLPERFPRRRDARSMNPSPEPMPEASPGLAGQQLSQEPLLTTSQRQTSPKLAYAPDAEERVEAVNQYSQRVSHIARSAGGASKLDPRTQGATARPAQSSRGTGEANGLYPDLLGAELTDGMGATPGAVPAWLHGQPTAERSALAFDPAAPVIETLQHTRERVASRWYALRGVFDPATPEMEPTQARTRETGTPALALFSLAGGAGKTSLAASLARSLSAAGEKVLLADLTPQGILPFYFGATELRQGVVRTFAPPAGSADAPVSMISYDLFDREEASQGAEEHLAQQLAARREGFDHLVADVSPAGIPMLRQLTQRDALVLVPVAPDMNTVITLAAMERFFADMVDSSGRPVQPHYLLTQFEASLPLHLDVREGLRQKLGQRLLPFVIRRSPEVAEALAEGMTVIDYAPEAGVASDYQNLANWVRALGRRSRTPARGGRWSEQ